MFNEQLFGRLVTHETRPLHDQLQERYTNLDYAQIVSQKPGHRVLIDDVSYRLSGLDGEEAFWSGFTLKATTNNRIQLLHFPDLMEQLNSRLHTLTADYSPDQTLLIFPGRGAQQVKDMLPRQFLETYPNQIDLGISRKKDGEGRGTRFDEEQLQGVKQTIERLYGRKPPDTGLIFDDVTHSGSTSQAIAGATGWDETRWVSASAAMTSPLWFPNPSETASGVAGIDQAWTSVVVDGTYNLLSGILKMGSKQSKHLRELLSNYVKPGSLDTFKEHYLQLWFAVNRVLGES